MRKVDENGRSNPGEENCQSQDQKLEEDIFKMEEIEVEELAIDGICGVY